MRNIVITGAGRGLGNSMINGPGKTGDHFFLVSGTKPLQTEIQSAFKMDWIPANLSDLSHIDSILRFIDDSPVDVLIFNTV